MYQRHRAHRTRLQCRVQGRTRETVVAELAAGIAQGKDLGVRTRIVERDVAVPAFADHLPVDNQHGTHRHLAVRIARMRRQLQRPPHPAHVIGRKISRRSNVHAYSHSIVAGGLPLMS